MRRRNIYVALCNHYSTGREANDRFRIRHPLIEDLLAGVVKFWGIDKDELITVFLVAQDLIRETINNGHQTRPPPPIQIQNHLPLRRSVSHSSPQHPSSSTPSPSPRAPAPDSAAVQAERLISTPSTPYTSPGSSAMRRVQST